METLSIDNLEREKARNLVISLPRNEEFLAHTLKDGRRIFLKTEGKKRSRIGNKKIGGIDIIIRVDEEKRKLNYLSDIIIDLIKKEVIVGNKNILIILQAIKDSIELTPLEKIMEKYPELKEMEKKNLPGHSIEFLLVISKLLALQEDVNYWGINPKTKKSYEGREKPYNALTDLFVKRMDFRTVIKKHML